MSILGYSFEPVNRRPLISKNTFFLLVCKLEAITGLLRLARWVQRPVLATSPFVCTMGSIWIDQMYKTWYDWGPQSCRFASALLLISNQTDHVHQWLTQKKALDEIWLKKAMRSWQTFEDYCPMNKVLACAVGMPSMDRYGSDGCYFAGSMSDVDSHGRAHSDGSGPVGLLVCGGAVVDCIVRPFDSQQHGASRTSMPGEARISHGGVGRNLAEVSLRLGCAVHLLSAVGGDEPGRQLLSHCRQLGSLWKMWLSWTHFALQPTQLYLMEQESWWVQLQIWLSWTTSSQKYWDTGVAHLMASNLFFVRPILVSDLVVTSTFFVTLCSLVVIPCGYDLKLSGIIKAAFRLKLFDMICPVAFEVLKLSKQLYKQHPATRPVCGLILSPLPKRHAEFREYHGTWPHLTGRATGHARVEGPRLHRMVRSARSARSASTATSCDWSCRRSSSPRIWIC